MYIKCSIPHLAWPFQRRANSFKLSNVKFNIEIIILLFLYVCMNCLSKTKMFDNHAQVTLKHDQLPLFVVVVVVAAELYTLISHNVRTNLVKPIGIVQL